LRLPGFEEASLRKLGVAVGGEVRDNSLPDEAPETLKLGAAVAGEGVEEVGKGNIKEECEDESKPDDDGDGRDGDVESG
jgi:hypothetical protein